jgi:TrmH family RNA methyltransferase
MNNTEITSLNNELIKETAKLKQKKYRDEEKKFLLEGFKVIQEAFLSNIEIENVFVLHKNASKYIFLKDKLIFTTEAVLKKISTTDSIPDAVAVAKQKVFTIENIQNPQRVILLENIKDLGNLGTILRTAKAFSQDLIILFGDTVDLYNPKCIRASVGNLWKIPIVQIKDLNILKSVFKNHEKIATLPKAKNTISLNQFNSKQPYLIMFGAEAEGLSEDLINFATKKVTIEMNKEVESLNLSVAVGILLYMTLPK